jgi:hypothetical protein
VSGWSERRDLNPGPPVPQTGELTGLRYAPPSRDPMLYAGRRCRARAKRLRSFGILAEAARDKTADELAGERRS